MKHLIKTLNWLRAQVAKKNEHGDIGIPRLIILCECSEIQSDDHLLQCTLASPKCKTDLALVNEKAITVATYWLKSNI